MIKLILDTNICVYILNNKPEHIARKFYEYGAGEIAISSIVLPEPLYGLHKSKYKKSNKAVLDKLLDFLEIVPFGDKEALTYAKIRSKLESAGCVIGSMDMLIASVALANDLVLVTNNQKEFARISNLKLQNWA